MEKTVSVIPKNKAEELRIAVKEFKGYDYVEIRTFVEPYADKGQGRVPTKKGVTLRLEKLVELIGALQEAQQAARAAGVLNTKPKAE